MFIYRNRTNWSLLISALLILGRMFLFPAAAFARDCPPNDPSRSDCQGAATTARNPLVPIAGAGVGGAAGWVAGQAISRGKNKSKEKEKEEKEKKDPCQEDLDRLKRASMQARTMQAARQRLQSLLNLLETQYENTREASYLSGAIGLGFIGGSIFTAPLSGALGRAAVQQALARKLAESALKALGQQVMKEITNAMLEQGVSWESLVTQPLNSARMAFIQNSISEAIVQDQMRPFILQGLDPNSPVGRSVRSGISTNVAGPVASAFGNFISLASMAEGVLSGAKKLEAIRAQMKQVRQSLFEAEMRFEDAVSEMEVARSSYEYCRKLWQQ
ncbi:MAG: hypothetical protein ACE5E7_18965 [Anaerolineae bacterium]